MKRMKERSKAMKEIRDKVKEIGLNRSFNFIWKKIKDIAKEKGIRRRDIEVMLRKMKERENIKKQKVYDFEEVKRKKKMFLLALSEPISENERNWKGYGMGGWRENAIKEWLFYLTEKGRANFREWDSFDKKNRGSFCKINLLAVDTENQMALIQVFWYAQWKSKEHSTSRKNYYIVGLTETKRTFTHSISGQLAWSIVKLFRKGKSFKDKFEKWAFGKKIEYHQGEIGFVKIRKLKELESLKSNRIVIGRHIIVADEVYKHGKDIIVRNFSIFHNQHYPIEVKDNEFYKVVVAKREKEWKFSERVGD